MADGLALAVRVGRQIDGVDAFGGLLQFLNELLLALDDLVAR
jgi:hypothetical protein